MERLTFREILAGYIVMHLETNKDGTDIKNSKKNERIFNIATKIMGGREKLDNAVKKIIKRTIEYGIIENDLSEEELSELNTNIR